jgi:quercetin dioxygenase-like cupin family protein
MGIFRSDGLWVTVAVLVSVAALVPMLAMAADEDPLQDFCVADNSTALPTINGFPCKPAHQVTVWDFTSGALKNRGNTSNKNMAAVTPASVTNFAGLNTLGISAARIDFDKGGINPPHTHPRATELLFLAKGELYVGFVDTNNTLFATTIKAGELFVFPKALVHFQLNVGNGPALAFSALSSQNPGVQQIAPALFGSVPPVSDEVLEKGFRIGVDTVRFIEKQFAA